MEDDSGGVVREVAKDVDAIQLYKSMKETLVYLTHLDPEDTQAIMLEKLQRQVSSLSLSLSLSLSILCPASVGLYLCIMSPSPQCTDV